MGARETRVKQVNSAPRKPPRGPSWTLDAFDTSLVQKAVAGDLSLRFDSADVGRMTLNLDGRRLTQALVRQHF